MLSRQAFYGGHSRDGPVVHARNFSPNCCPASRAWMLVTICCCCCCCPLQDVEGFELQVLQGAESLLAKYKANYVVAECTFGGEARQRQMLK
jgi:hypothetical protein